MNQFNITLSISNKCKGKRRIPKEIKNSKVENKLVTYKNN